MLLSIVKHRPLIIIIQNLIMSCVMQKDIIILHLNHFSPVVGDNRGVTEEIVKQYINALREALILELYVVRCTLVSKRSKAIVKISCTLDQE